MVSEIAGTLARLVLRRDSDLRERARATNIIVEVHDEDAKQCLLNARQAWGQQIPDRGAHPYGSPAGFAFEALAEWASRSADVENATMAQREETQFWKGMAPRRDHVMVFAPALKRQWKETPEGVWLWKLSIRAVSRLGVETQEMLTDPRSTGYFSRWGKIREDYAPESWAARELREYLRQR